MTTDVLVIESTKPLRLGLDLPDGQIVESCQWDAASRRFRCRAVMPDPTPEPDEDTDDGDLPS